MNGRTKAMRFSPATKERIYDRDHRRCVYCGSYEGEPVAHYISRAQGGLGIEQNGLTLCWRCHRRYDQSEHRWEMRDYFRDYLKAKYPDWDESKLTYRSLLEGKHAESY